MRRGTKRPHGQTILIATPDPWKYDPSIPLTTRKQVIKLVVDYALFFHPDEWTRRSVAYKLYHTCRAFRQWPIIHRLLSHAIADHLSDGMRECKNWDFQLLFPGVALFHHHWWWTHRLSVFNEVLDTCFDTDLYHPGSWKEEPVIEIVGSPFRFVNVNQVLLKHSYDEGVENVLFWEAPDAPSLILFTYTLLRHVPKQDFVVTYTIKGSDKATLLYSRGGIDFWYLGINEFMFEDFLSLLMENNPKARDIMKESWDQTSLTPVERFERFVDRWFTRTPQLPILPRE